MVDKQFIAYFKLAHGFFNVSMMALFVYQGWMGYLIRSARTAGQALPIDAVRRHRKAGPVFALWGALGFAAGIIMVLLDKGRILEYPLHFFVGLSIVLCICGVYVISRRIKGPDPQFRNIHFGLGLLLLTLYVVQVLLGLGILL